MNSLGSPTGIVVAATVESEARYTKLNVSMTSKIEVSPIATVTDEVCTHLGFRHDPGD